MTTIEYFFQKREQQQEIYFNKPFIHAHINHFIKLYYFSVKVVRVEKQNNQINQDIF